MADLLHAVADGVATITLNRPERKNAFTFDMCREWAAHLRAARWDDDVRVVVVRGAGDAFCSGVDLDDFVPRDGSRPTPLQRKQQLTEAIHQVALALDDLDKPVVAGLNGVAVGAGLDMALMCDLRIAARSARLAEGYVTVGLVPGDGGCYFLPRLIGLGRALEMLLTGTPIDATEAERIGLVNHVHDDADFDAELTAFAARLAALPPVSVRMIKRATYASLRLDLRGALDLVSSHMAVVTQTADHEEAVAALRERRTPRYEGR